MHAISRTRDLEGISLTPSDMERIQSLIAANPDIECSLLNKGLRAAKVLRPEESDAKMVRVGSEFIYTDSAFPEREFRSELVLETLTSRGRISVLSPLGALMLGLKEGDEIAYESAFGPKRKIKIKKVL